MEIKLFILVLVANGSPIVVARLLGQRLAWPLDHGQRLGGQPLLGASKTWRGIITAILSSCLAAWLLQLPISIGALIGIGAMAGDLLASFTKRRLGLASSSMAPGLDQIPESLLPLLMIEHEAALTSIDITIMVLVFIVLELLLSRIGYALKLRNRPY